MRRWQCRLTPDSMTLLREQTGIEELNQNIELKEEFDTPSSYVHARALDSLSILIQQERPRMAPEELGALVAEMVLNCEEVGTDKPPA